MRPFALFKRASSLLRFLTLYEAGTVLGPSSLAYWQAAEFIAPLKPYAWAIGLGSAIVLIILCQMSRKANRNSMVVEAMAYSYFKSLILPVGTAIKAANDRIPHSGALVNRIVVHLPPTTAELEKVEAAFKSNRNNGTYYPTPIAYHQRVKQVDVETTANGNADVQDYPNILLGLDSYLISEKKGTTPNEQAKHHDLFKMRLEQLIKAERSALPSITFVP